MDLFFYITIIVGFSLIYYGYIKKSDNDLKKKELELEEKKIALEMKKIDHNKESQDQDEHR